MTFLLTSSLSAPERNIRVHRRPEFLSNVHGAECQFPLLRPLLFPKPREGGAASTGDAAPNLRHGRSTRPYPSKFEKRCERNPSPARNSPVPPPEFLRP